MKLSEYLDIIKTAGAILTPLLVLFFGWKINKKFEANKLSLLKEKEFQVRWAELFLTKAIEFNKHVTEIIYALYISQNETDNKKIEEITKTLRDNTTSAKKIEWEIQNYYQFSKKYSKDVNDSQRKLLNLIREIEKNKGGDLEVVRIAQFEYNQAVRNAHNEILNSKLPKEKAS